MIELAQKEQQLQAVADKISKSKLEISKFIVGQEDVVDQVLWTIFAGGHALLEGLPGLGKTMLIRTISEVMNLDFSRIQFTPDLMPSDITGTMMLEPNEHGKQNFVFHEGPVFANIVLADEINRATPKTQSSLLEAMAEKTVTVMGDTKKLAEPFFVLATQNPLDTEGTYPLPEAQMDRFLLKINVDYPTKEQLKEIIKKTTTTTTPSLQKVINRDDIVEIQNLAKEILVSDDVLEFATNIIVASHPTNDSSPEMIRKFVRYGSGPRGLQSMIQIGKVHALSNSRVHLSKGDIKKCAKAVLRHRLFLNFEGEAAGISTDTIIEELITTVEQSVNKK
ncbi:AAA family ATPase [Bacillus sp. SM2101]|uniref:AAA family ATPase n=1 Tax=Bacillus sp. SM2101 TaxID=2805366 RepID=UPI001BDE85B7